MSVVVIPTGSANLASVIAAVRGADSRPDLEPTVSGDADRIRDAAAVILPGVGAFGPAMMRLEALGCIDALRRRIDECRPTLAICLGLQLLAASSDESPGIAGLGVITAPIEAIDDLRDVAARVPHMGRTALDLRPLGDDLACSIDAYFAHGYGLRTTPDGWRSVRIGTSRGSVVAALRRGVVLACQFHPELSGPGGLDLIRAWLAVARTSISAPASIGDALEHPCLRAPLRRLPSSESPLVASTPAPWARTRLIPCLDLRRGRVVKGVRFGDLVDLGDPVDLASRYADDGADEIVLLDIDATVDGRVTSLRTIEAVRAHVAAPLTVGGGVRTLDDVEALLRAGADKVTVNSAAIERPGLIDAIATRFGRQCTVVAVDALRNDAHPRWWTVRSRAGGAETGLDAVDWCREAVRRGAGELLVTSIDRDGTRSGYDLGLMRAIADAVRVPLIASGGAGRPQDLREAADAGVDGLLVAGMLHRGEATVASLRAALTSVLEPRPLETSR